MSARTIFVTGTNTNAGKTIVTALMMAHARASGIKARGLKPFSTGDRTDAQLLWDLQDREIPLDEVNPYHFAAPVSPWTAARLENRSIGLHHVLPHLVMSCASAELCLIEGAGGLLSPLGEDFTAATLIAQLRCEVIIVAANHLGVLNHVMLTLASLQQCRPSSITIVLTERGGSDAAHRTNLDDLVLLTRVEVVSIPFLENCRPEAAFICNAAQKLAPILDRLMQKKSPGHGCRGDSFP